MSKAILKVYIDYSTGQLSSEEAFFVADDITQFIEQAKTLNCAVNEIRITCCKLDTISRLIKKATRNNRPAKLNASNLNLIRTFEKLERGAKVMQGYCLFGKGGREDFQGDVTVTILPELSLIAVDQFHY